MLTRPLSSHLLRWTHPPSLRCYNSATTVVLYAVTMYLSSGAVILRRISLMRRSAVVLFAFALTTLVALAAAPAPAYSQDQDQPPGNPDQGQNSSYQAFSAEQLDNLLAPIALYPDPLLAQALVAATFPDQVEEAARWVRGNGQRGVDDQNWDISVKAIAHYPSVVGMMADKIDWTTSIGQAYVNQGSDVSAAVQRLRHLAHRVGNLETTPQQEVIENGEYIAIDPVQPQYIYVPVYDPAICFYRRPYWGPAIVFGGGFPIGAWLNVDFRWGFGGGWGGVFYTGWHPWGGWNDRWIGRCRPFVRVDDRVYVNERFRNVTVNRTVINRTVNVTNINNYNYVHKNVTYNNVQVNNTRVNRVNNVRVNNVQQNHIVVNNKELNRNIDTNNSRANEFRGRDNNINNNRPPQAQQQQRPQQQVQQQRPQQQIQQQRPQQQIQQQRVQQQQVQQQQQRQGLQSRPDFRQQNNTQARPQNQIPQNQGPHTFGRSEGNFNPQVSSQRGQTSRAQAAQPPRTYNPPPSRGGGGGGGGGHPSGGGGHPAGGRKP
jgi:hypothetical protein